MGHFLRNPGKRGVFVKANGITNTRNRGYIIFSRYGVQVMGNEHKYPLILWEWGEEKNSATNLLLLKVDLFF